jgi:protein ImuB
MSAPLSTRYLSLWLRRLSTDRITRSERPDVRRGVSAARSGAPDVEPGAVGNASATTGAPAAQPLAVVAPIKSALRLTGLNDAAANLGLKIGMALADARAMYPRLVVADADSLADSQALDAIADWCDRYTPLVGLHPPDGLVLDISGCAHLLGGEAVLLDDLVRRLRRHGFAARAAIADTVGCAWAMARHATHDRSIVPSGAMRDALAPLPTGALRLAPETVTLLAQVGLKQVADLLERPRAALAARFGAELIWRLDQALGVDRESITPRLPLPRYVAEQRFADPIGLERDVLGTIQRLGERLKATLERHHEGARLIEAVLFRVDGKVLRLAAATSRPIRDAALMRRLFAERLTAVGDEHDPGFGFDMIRLSVIVTDPLDPRQSGFDASDHDDELAALIDRLGARLSFRCVRRIVPQDTHIPEFGALEVPANQTARQAPSCGAASEPRDERVRRPLTLLARPERIEAVAEVPDGPPVRFRWRRVLHEVVIAEGPERLAMEWWRDDADTALTRDYFRIESRDGARFWLYREGLYARETIQPRWFLHGLFA